MIRLWCKWYGKLKHFNQINALRYHNLSNEITFLTADLRHIINYFAKMNGSWKRPYIFVTKYAYNSPGLLWKVKATKVFVSKHVRWFLSMALFWHLSCSLLRLEQFDLVNESSSVELILELRLIQREKMRKKEKRW